MFFTLTLPRLPDNCRRSRVANAFQDFSAAAAEKSVADEEIFGLCLDRMFYECELTFLNQY
jgi:hypothetical protein